MTQQAIEYIFIKDFKSAPFFIPRGWKLIQTNNPDIFKLFNEMGKLNNLLNFHIEDLKNFRDFIEEVVWHKST
jgi:hypothetical protein